MLVEQLARFMQELGVGFYTGVPDSQLQPFCDYLHEMHRDSSRHVIECNEGSATGLAAGYHLSTGRIPCVYMQNSGIGNAVNPLTSLLSDQVYAIPVLFLVGWRGEPGHADEPQHVFQGAVTLTILRDLDVGTFILDKTTTYDELAAKRQEIVDRFSQGKSFAIVVRKDALVYQKKQDYSNGFTMGRESAIEKIVDASINDILVGTTGKISRELYEIRERNGQSHRQDFLTVGSMGHSSSIALGIAMNTDRRVWCIDGDGALLMHMGALAVIGSLAPRNFIHIVLNNAAHDTVGGMPTASGTMDIPAIAAACGYKHAHRATCMEELATFLTVARESNELSLIEIEVRIGSRSDLGRPTTTPVQNKEMFMLSLQSGI